MTAPTVSVVMAVHNGEKYVRDAIASILTQSYRDFELIVVNDGSTDHTAALLRSFTDARLHVLDNPINMGLTHSLNRGLAEARGRYVARHDADDISRRDRLARQVAYAESHRDVVIVGSDVRLIDAHGRLRRGPREIRAASPLGVQWSLLFGNPFAHSATLFRRDIVCDEFGGYDERCLFNQDFELWSRVLARYDGVNLPAQLVDLRLHPTSIIGRRDDAVRASRTLNVGRNVEIQRQNVGRILERADLAEQWPLLWTGMNVTWLTGDPLNAAAAVNVVEDMHACFVARHALAVRDADVARVLASVLARIACFLAARDRAAALRAYARALRVDAAVAGRVIARFAALLTLGETGISNMRRLRTLGEPR